MLIYKILLPSEWAEFDQRGQFDGSPFDLSSGFIHCFSRVQVGATALRVFPDEPELVVVALETEMLGDAGPLGAGPERGNVPTCIRATNEGRSCR